MQKSRKSRMRDAEKKGNKVWVHDPNCNIRQASGVMFGGKWMTKRDYQLFLIGLRLAKGGDNDGL